MKLRAARMLVGLLSLALSVVQMTFAQAPTETASALPRLVRLSGTVKDLNGSPLNGVVGITFALYSEQTGGAALWLETQNVTADINGHYTALLGSSKPDGLPTDVFTSEQARWVGVQVSGQVEQPRMLLVSAPYAFKAGDAETVGGLPASAFVLASSGSAAATNPRSSAAPASGTPSRNSPPANPAVTGKGVVDYIPMWDTTSDIVDSIIFQKSSKIGISTTTPATPLDVNGKTDVRDTLTLFPNSTDNTLAVNGTSFKIDSTGKVTFISGQTFPGAGTITGVTTASGSGLSGGGTTGTLSLKVPSAGITNAMLANSKITLNANTAGGLTAPGAMSLGNTYTIGLKPCTANQILQYSGSVWNCASAGTGTVTSVATGLGLTGGPITGSGTLSINTTVVPQLGASNTFTGNQTVIGTFGVTGNGNNLLVGDPGCGSGFAAFGFLPSGGLSGCDNYALLGDSVGGTYINSSGTATTHFRSNNNELATIDNFGNVKVIGQNGGGNMTVAGVLTVNGNQAVSSGPGGMFTGYTAPLQSGANGTDGIDTTGGTSDLDSGDNFGGAGIVATGGVGSAAAGDAPGGVFYGGGYAGDGIDAIVPFSSEAYAGYFQGNIDVTGAIYATTKDFKIDHPLDPANKYLVHASVESSEMMNIYTGNVTTDSQGQATVQLPEWFEVLNTDFRYQLTVIGQFAQAIVAHEIENNRFEVRTSAPNVKVSWQVTGVRQDAYAKANPLVVEQEKEERLRGYYIHPDLYGAPPEKQIEWARHPQMMKKMQEIRAKQQAAIRPAAQPRTVQLPK